MMFAQRFLAALLVYFCLCHLVAADAPAPPPFDPSVPACQFDVGYGLYDLTPLNVRAPLRRRQKKLSFYFRNSASKF
jgi:hypothetical protein